MWGQNLRPICDADRSALSGPVIFNLTYDSISQTGIILFWATDSPADSKVWWMKSDSNYQPLIFTDSIYLSEAVKNHIVPVGNLQPATIYNYLVASGNGKVIVIDSGFFINLPTSSTRKYQATCHYLMSFI